MDSDIPFPPHLLFLELDDLKSQFLPIQNYYLTATIDLEKGFDNKHLHFFESGNEHFHIYKYFGSGRYG